MGSSLKGICRMVVAAIAMTVVVPGSAWAILPTNDDIDNAKPLPSHPRTQWDPYFDRIETVTATAAADDPDCHGSQHSVWYQVTPPQDLVVEADTFGSTYDTVLSAYSGTRGALDQLVCSDDGIDSATEAKIEFIAPAETTTYVMVSACCDDVPSPGGVLDLRVWMSLPPVDIELTITRTGFVDLASGDAIVRGTLACSRNVEIYLWGSLRQANGQIVRGYYERKVECGPDELSWTARAQGSGRGFHGGLLRVEGHATTADRPRRLRQSVEENQTVYFTGCTLMGNPDDNYIAGTSRDDVICGLGGNDRIVGKGGEDRVIGGPGRDRVYGGDGNDNLFGGRGEGVNFLDGGDGTDLCRKETERDELENCETTR